jgi:pimeloyl-ACP methyl ester carboxylesterase
VIHPVDAAARLALRAQRGRSRTFHRGWGDETLHPLHDVATLEPERLAPLQIDWGPARDLGDVVVTDGTFPSPAPHLPPAGRTGLVRRISAAGGARAWCVWIAAWNDHGWQTRSTFARRLAADGIGSVLVENPYYGARRAGDGREQPIATVADFGVMGRAAVIEGTALVHTLAAAGTPVAVAGYSMGGNLAAMVAAASTVPVATAALAASYSPAPVFLEGVPAAGIAWQALGPRQTAIERIACTLGLASVLRMPVPPHVAAAVIVGGRRDGFVPPAATVALHEHWADAELRWLDMGHATMLWFAKDALSAAVTDALNRLG